MFLLSAFFRLLLHYHHLYPKICWTPYERRAVCVCLSEKMSVFIVCTANNFSSFTNLLWGL